MKNPFKIQKETYLHRENTNKVSTFIRFILFIFDFVLFYLMFLIAEKFIGIFTNTTNNIEIIIIFFCSIIYTLLEYYFDGTVFKIIFGIRSISTNGNKLNYFVYLFKFYLRFFVIFVAIVRIWTMLIPIVFIFNLFNNFRYYKIISEFLGLEMKGLWYDGPINQNVVYINQTNQDCNKDLEILTSHETIPKDNSLKVSEELYEEKIIEKTNKIENLKVYSKKIYFIYSKILEKLTSDEVIIISIILGSIFFFTFGNLFGEIQYFRGNGERVSKGVNFIYRKIDFNYIIAIISFIIAGGISYIYLNRKSKNN